MSIKEYKNNEEYRQSGSDSDVYSDFSMSFLPHPHTGQVSRIKDIESVKGALKTLVLTNKYERLKNPDWGCNVRRHLFEDFHSHVLNDIKADIQNAIDRFEPRVNVHEIKVTGEPDQNAINIIIQFSILTAKNPQEVELTLYRVR